MPPELEIQSLNEIVDNIIALLKEAEETGEKISASMMNTLAEIITDATQRIQELQWGQPPLHHVRSLELRLSYLHCPY